MQNNNSNPVPPTPVLPHLSSTLCSIIGVLCSCIILFNLLTSDYPTNFNVSTISSCDNAGSVYLGKLEVVYQVVVWLDVVGLVMFGVGLVGGIVGVWGRVRVNRDSRDQGEDGQEMEKMEERESWGWFVARSLIGYVAILSSGCLFGNCVKTAVSIKQTETCASDQNSSLSSGYQTLSLLSGICLLMSILIFILSPKTWRQPSEQSQPLSSQSSSKITKRTTKINEMQQESQELVDQNTYGLLISVQDSKTEVVEDTGHTNNITSANLKQNSHLPRIFGKTFLSESRYGLSPVQILRDFRTDSKKPRKDSLDTGTNLKQKQRPSPLDLQLRLGIQCESREELSSRSDKKTQRSIHNLQNHLIKLTEQGPPVQMGHFSHVAKK